jgi:hypothetical protein
MRRAGDGNSSGGTRRIMFGKILRNLKAIFGGWKALYICEVKGESFHKRELISITGKKPEAGYRQQFRAQLIPEDGNKKDENAVRVEINKKHVGYLNREDAMEYRKRKYGKRGCRAIIVCGGGDNYGVWLDEDLGQR